MARLWAEAVNRRGGSVTVVHLPEVGIRGNTHFPFSDLNNVEVADQMSTPDRAVVVGLRDGAMQLIISPRRKKK